MSFTHLYEHISEDTGKDPYEVLVDTVVEELKSEAQESSDQYLFSTDVRKGFAGEDVVEWIKENDPTLFKELLGDPDKVSGHDVLFTVLRKLGLVKPWTHVDPDVDYLDDVAYQQWLNYKESEASRYEE